MVELVVRLVVVVVRLVVVVPKGWIRKGVKRRLASGGEGGRHRDGSRVCMYAYCMYDLVCILHVCTLVRARVLTCGGGGGEAGGGGRGAKPGEGWA